MKNKANSLEIPEVILNKTDTKSLILSTCTDGNSENDVQKVSHLRDKNKSTALDFMCKSCIDYSSRVWDVVRAEIQSNDS
ncbi:MAG: hypothetical protein PHE33_06660 [Bacteroidales bacterium]|nr:hypothetical protein [Bacteroidales bacterium]